MKSLADVIAFNEANAAREMPFFGQELFVAAQAMPGLDDPAYRRARADSQRQAAAAIDGVLKQAQATAIVIRVLPIARVVFVGLMLISSDLG